MCWRIPESTAKGQVTAPATPQTPKGIRRSQKALSLRIRIANRHATHWKTLDPFDGPKLATRLMRNDSRQVFNLERRVRLP